MSLTAETRREAEALAARLRNVYRGTDWRVTIVAPLFKGDTYRVNVH